MPASSWAVPVLPAKLISAPAMALPRGAFGDHAPHRARQKGGLRGRQHLERRHPSGALLSSVSQRPCGIRPPAAMVAATRAILNGVISTSPWPYAAKGSDLRSSGIAGGDSHLRGGLGERLRADIVNAELREIGIAGDRDGALHIDACRGRGRRYRP